MLTTVNFSLSLSLSLSKYEGRLLQDEPIEATDGSESDTIDIGESDVIDSGESDDESDSNELGDDSDTTDAKDSSSSDDDDKITICVQKKKKKKGDDDGDTDKKKKKKKKGDDDSPFSYKKKKVKEDSLDEYLEDGGYLVGDPIPDMDGMVFDEDCDATPGDVDEEALDTLECVNDFATATMLDFEALGAELPDLANDLYLLPFKEHERVFGNGAGDDDESFQACGIVYEADRFIDEDFLTTYQISTLDDGSGTPVSTATLSVSSIQSNHEQVLSILEEEFLDSDPLLLEFLYEEIEDQEMKFAVVSGYMLGEGATTVPGGNVPPLLLFFVFEAKYNVDEEPIVLLHVIGEESYFFGEDDNIFLMRRRGLHQGSGRGRELQTVVRPQPTLCEDYTQRAVSLLQCPSGQETVVVNGICISQVQANGQSLYEDAVATIQTNYRGGVRRSFNRLQSRSAARAIGSRWSAVAINPLSSGTNRNLAALYSGYNANLLYQRFNARQRSRQLYRSVQTRGVVRSSSYSSVRNANERHTIRQWREDARESARCTPLVNSASSCLRCATCSLIDADTECCEASDCPSNDQSCVANTCVFRGNPSFQLRWFGDGERIYFRVVLCVRFLLVCLSTDYFELMFIFSLHATTP